MRVGVFVRVNVLVGPGVLVGEFGFVTEAVRVGFFEGVTLGSTTNVYVGGMVGVGVFEIVGVGTVVGVDVITLWISPCACASETGTISFDEQYAPVMVQAVVSSSSVSGLGSEGPLTASVPFSPPSFTLEL